VPDIRIVANESKGGELAGGGVAKTKNLKQSLTMGHKKLYYEGKRAAIECETSDFMQSPPRVSIAMK
jgi:hypothetical protein